MRILVAPQAFKGTITGEQASQSMEDGILQVIPNATIFKYPLADGGDGSLDVLMGSSGQRMRSLVKDALGRPHEVMWGILSDGHTAVIELARICGLAQLQKERNNVNIATTYGVGEAIKEALDKGLRRIIIACGGSASNDAGVGIAQALGTRFLDSKGKELPQGGLALEKLCQIDLSHLDARLHQCEIIALCDVINPLLGPRGATQTYARQKGASETDIEGLEKAMQRFAEIAGHDVGSLPMGGSAGGTGAGLYALLGATLVEGAQYILEALQIEKFVKDVNLVLTGEGCLDMQTGFGKAPGAIARLARKHNVPHVAIVGSVEKNTTFEGFDAVFPLSWLPLEKLPTPQVTIKALARLTEQVLRLLME